MIGCRGRVTYQRPSLGGTSSWPTYIFTRVYAQRSAGYHDTEIAALKAVAKRADAMKQGIDQGESAADVLKAAGGAKPVGA